MNDPYQAALPEAYAADTNRNTGFGLLVPRSHTAQFGFILPGSTR